MTDDNQNNPARGSVSPRSELAQPDAAERVGYGRPPTASRFKPGQSGNPRGRPRGSRSVGAILQDVMNRKVSVTENGRTRRVSALEGVMHRLFSEALRGDKAALRILLPLSERHAAAAEGAGQTEALRAEDLEILARFARDDGALFEGTSIGDAVGTGRGGERMSEGRGAEKGDEQDGEAGGEGAGHERAGNERAGHGGSGHEGEERDDA